ncbi:GntR family transcriptional regulator [Mycolicibacterium sp.]|uniref:GntR family transcriptional regulator n=1 Tax=Mycolicibacterium sp. TaxID=2320850 RepID=UPI003D121138
MATYDDKAQPDGAELDLDAADLRVQRGSVPASAQLSERLKALILEQRLPPGSRLPSERELIERSGLSRVTVRAAVGLLEKEGWLLRRQGLGTFVSEPVNQELAAGVRTITEVLLASGVTPDVDVIDHGVVTAPHRVQAALGAAEVLRIRRRYRDKNQPLALVTIYLPTDLGDAVAPLLADNSATETTYTMWERRLGVRIGDATHEIHAAGASMDVADALGLSEGAPVLVLERTTYTVGGGPLEVVVFHHRPERYGFSMTLSREMSRGDIGVTER